MKLSIVIPVYNESRRIKKTLCELFEYLKTLNYDYEVIIVNDGSKDNTIAIASESSNSKTLIIDNPKNKGKGFVVRQGMLAATGDYILFMDADMATPIDQLPLFIECLNNGAQFAYAIRTHQKYDNKKRFLLGLGFLFLAHLFALKEPVIDTQCGFKMFNKETANFIFSKMRINGGVFDVEMFFIAQKHKIKGRYISVLWDAVPGSTINIFKCILFDPIDLIRIRIYDILGFYRHNQTK